MHSLVKILSGDDGDEYADPKWCLVDPANDQGTATFCTAEFFGLGESACRYETKETERGGITCPGCLRKLKKLKAVRL